MHSVIAYNERDTFCTFVEFNGFYLYSNIPNILLYAKPYACYFIVLRFLSDEKISHGVGILPTSVSELKHN